MLNNMNNVMDDNDLVNAAGGNVTMGDRLFTNYVDGASAVPGENYFILLNDGRNWTYGTLEENTERDIFGSKIARQYVFQLHIINGDYIEVPQRYKAANVSLYRNCFTSAEGKF